MDPEASEATGGANGLTKRQRRLAERRRRREAARERQAQLDKAEATRKEERAEAVAPAAQRKPVVDRHGATIRGARLEPDGLTFKVSNPVRHLAARGKKRTEAGGQPTITQAHVVASDRLRGAWEIAGGGIGVGAANYGERAGGTASSGTIAAAVLASVVYQSRMRAELDGAKAWLGALWRAVEVVVLHGVDVAAWAAQTGRDDRAAVGYLGAALDRLVEFYVAIDRHTAGRTAPTRGAAIVRTPAEITA